METITTIIVLTLAAGASMPLGAALACVDAIYPKWLNSEARHGIIAFGGGALVSAVALVLVPEGCEALSVVPAAISFAAGGLAFLALDVALDRWQSPAGQLVAMLSDFIPESIALGASFATGGAAGVLLAGLIAIQNLPEGFNAYRELIEAGKLGRLQILLAFCLMALLGPAAGMIGYFWLSDLPSLLGALMLFASGGILYLVFQDIAPDAHMKHRWRPPLGAIGGFLLGMIGNMLVAP